MVWIQDSSAYEQKVSNLMLDYCQLWLDTQEAKNLSPLTVKMYREAVMPFVKFLSKYAQSLDEVQPAHIRQWILFKKRQGVKPQTLNNAYRLPKMFWQWCIKEGLTENDPFKNVERPKPERKVKPALTPEQVNAILKACEGSSWQSKRNRAFVLTLLDTGMRLRECLSLKVEDAQKEQLLIRGKGGKQRLVFISPETRLAIKRYLLACPYPLTDNSPLWWTERGELTVYGAKRLIGAIGKRAGVSPLGAHAFRRTFATWSLRNGIDLEHLRLLMGHSDYTVLRQYLSLVEEDLKRAHTEFSPLRMLRKEKR